MEYHPSGCPSTGTKASSRPSWRKIRFASLRTTSGSWTCSSTSIMKITSTESSSYGR